VREKPTVGSLFLGGFLSDSIPRGTKDVSVHFLIHNFHHAAIAANYTSEFRELSKDTAHLQDMSAVRTNASDQTVSPLCSSY